MMHLCMIHIYYVACIYVWSSSLDPDACMYDAHIYDPWSPWIFTWCIYPKCKYTWSLIIVCMMQIWMMQISMTLDPDACIHDAANFVTDGRTDGRTDGQGNSRCWMFDMISRHWKFPKSQNTSPPNLGFSQPLHTTLANLCISVSSCILRGLLEHCKIVQSNVQWLPPFVIIIISFDTIVIITPSSRERFKEYLVTC